MCADQREARELIDLRIARKVALTVTPFADSNYGDTSLYKYLSNDEVTRVKRLMIERPPFMPNEINDRQLRPLEMVFAKKGGQLVLRADAADLGLLPGFQNHNAMITMVKAGWSRMQVISLATLDGATFLNVKKDLGSVDVGKVADLLIVSGKPDLKIEET